MGIKGFIATSIAGVFIYTPTAMLYSGIAGCYIAAMLLKDR